MEKEVKSGDFLKDIEITIVFRSGGTDLSNLQKLMKAIVASSTSLVDTKIVTTESETKVNSNSERTLLVLTTKLYIE